jgi:hypothetical protein
MIMEIVFLAFLTSLAFNVPFRSFRYRRVVRHWYTPAICIQVSRLLQHLLLGVAFWRPGHTPQDFSLDKAH